MLSSGPGTLTLSNTSGLEFLDGSNGWSWMVFHGNLTDVNAALDRIVFQPDVGSTGWGYLAVYADDLGHSGGPAQQSDFYVELYIGEWNYPPGVSAPVQVYGTAGVPIRFSTAAGTEIRVSDPDAGDEPIAMSLQCDGGTLTFSEGDGEADSRMALEGSVSAINAALEGMLFRSAFQFSGWAYLHAYVNDLGHTGKSPSEPMASLFALLAAYDLGPGDVVYVDTGHYQLLRNTLITQNDSGVRIQGPPGDAVALVDRGNTASGCYAIELVNADNVTIDRLHVTGALYGIYAAGSSDSDGVTISNCTVFNNLDTGILLDVGNDAARISGNVVYGSRSEAWVDDSYDNQPNGIRARGNDSIITGNTVYDGAGTGISIRARVSQRTSAPAVRAATGSASVATPC